MRLAVGTVLIAAVLAGRAHAQALDTDAPAQPPLSPPGLVAPIPPPATPPAPPVTPDGAPRMFVEVLLGGVAGTAGLFTGGAIGYGIECARSCHDDSRFYGLLVGGAIGLTAATSAGVMYAGYDRGHDASSVLTWLGTVAGGAAGAIAVSRSDGGAAAVALVVTSAALGGAAMYTLSRTRRPSAAQVHLVPLVGQGGLQLSLVGSAF